MSEKREYEKEYKVQAVKLAKNRINKSSGGVANTGQHAVRMDQKNKNGRIGHRMRRTQSRGKTPTQAPRRQSRRPSPPI